MTRTINDNDSELLKPVFDNGLDTFSDGLIGTSDERNSLREDQDKEYLDSLRKDQEKEQAKKEELLRRLEKNFFIIATRGTLLTKQNGHYLQ